MNNRLSNKGLMGIVAALSLSIAVLGQNKVEQKVQFYLDGKVGNELIKKGTYPISIPRAENGKEGVMEIKVGKRVVTAPFTKRENPTTADADKMTYRENDDGTRTIASITPKGQKFSLILQDGATKVADK